MTNTFIDRTYEELWDQRSFKVDIDKKEDYKPAYATKKGTDNKFRHSAIRGVHDKTLLNQLFFSEKNTKNVQNKLRFTIWKMSREQFVIPEQNEIELQIVMRSIYLQYSRNLNEKFTEQIDTLNNIVVDHLAPDLLSSVKQYLKYLEDANEPYQLIQRPSATSSAGTKTLDISSALGFGDSNFTFQ